MRKIKIVIEYDGTAYYGWQYQTTGPTVQGVLEKALLDITKAKSSVVASGRTDSGVHAEAQVAHFVTESQMTPRQFMKALNSNLPRDIAILQVEDVPLEFNARASALGKIYRYTILNRDCPSALLRHRVWHISDRLDVEAMRRAAAYLVGELDFSAFRASGCDARTPMREIRRVDLTCADDLIHFIFEGDGFLKHMVRNMVGTLVAVGRGKISADNVPCIMASGDRKRAGPTAPPQGLTLVRVFYDDMRAAPLDATEAEERTRPAPRGG